MVTLSTWHHVIACVDYERLTDDLAMVEGVEIVLTDILRARAGLARREYVMYLIRSDRRVFAARTDIPRREMHDQNRLLNALVDTYKDRCDLHRAMTDSLDDARQLYPDLAAVLIFPQYEPAEVLTLARDGELLPAGLTRHLIQGRALRVNYPLSELKSSESLESKNTRLQAWMKRKLSTKEVRFYGETTYSFDE